ncbi:MAG: 50S ribosomal protein L6 [archaeon]
MKESVELPGGVQATFVDGLLSVKGPKGEATRLISVPGLIISVQDKSVVLETKESTKRDKKLLYTFVAHLKNLCKGVTEGHRYVLRICSGHFPMNVAMKGQVFEVKNFLGEKVPRVATLPQGVQVKIDAKDVIVEGCDLEKTAQAAATIEQLTKRVGFDRRIYQDGIYIIEKDGNPL